jgi:acetoin utilization deacetylase AcuC-like enzyme
MIGFCSSPRFVDHLTGPHHPERPDRIRAIHRAVRAAKMIDSPDPFPDFQLDLGPLDAGGVKLAELTPKAADFKTILAVHPQNYIDRVLHVCEIGGGILDQGDTAVGRESCDVALLSAGSLITCADAVMRGDADRAFSAARPPGHHAEPDRPMGFCLFSNVAIAVRHVQQAYGIRKIAIVDFDVHHGNGTQACFQADPSVLFISLHQDPRTCYPGSGYPSETGVGAGEGFTLNLPFRPGAGDEQYLDAFDAKVIPKLDAFRPEVMFISAGFDAHHDDPLAQIDLSESCFEQMTRNLVAVAEAHSSGRVISALEGGYHLRALGRSAVRHLAALAS